MELDRKEKWRDYKGKLCSSLLQGIVSPEEFLAAESRYKGALYETPKAYVDGVAYNDGTWVKYYYNGRIRCANKDEIGRYIYGYVCFLLKAGIDDWEELWFYSVCFLIEVLEYREGLFGCSMDNKQRIDSIIKKVCKETPENATTAIKDTRAFCMDPEMLKRMNAADKTRMQKAIQKKITDTKIAELDEPELKSIRKRAHRITEKGLPTSPSRLQQWITENKRQ